MNKFLSLLFFISFSLFGQTKGKLDLEKNITLEWEINTFDKSKHTFEFCL